MISLLLQPAAAHQAPRPRERPAAEPARTAEPLQGAEKRRGAVQPARESAIAAASSRRTRARRSQAPSDDLQHVQPRHLARPDQRRDRVDPHGRLDNAAGARAFASSGASSRRRCRCSGRARSSTVPRLRRMRVRSCRF